MKKDTRAVQRKALSSVYRYIMNVWRKRKGNSLARVERGSSAREIRGRRIGLPSPPFSASSSASSFERILSLCSDGIGHTEAGGSPEGGPPEGIPSCGESVLHFSGAGGSSAS